MKIDSRARLYCTPATCTERISYLMNVFTHPGRFSEDARRARRFWLAGLASIFISLTLSMASGLNQVLIFIAYPFLLVGLPLWTMGRAGQRRLKTQPRPELLLNAALKALSDKFSLHHYAPYGETKFDHLLVTPAGLVVIVTSDVPGPVTCTQANGSDRWFSPSNFLDRITGVKPSIGNPSIKATAQVEIASSLLKAAAEADVPVKGLIVFTQNPDLELAGCTHAAVPLEEVRLAVKLLQDEMSEESSQEEARGRMLTSDQRRRLNAALSPQIAPVVPRAVPAKR